MVDAGAASAGGDGSTGADHDLTRTISEYLDLHLMFPLLDFVEMNNMYDSAGVSQARLDLLEPTNMVDYAMEVYQNLHNGAAAPKEMVVRRDKVFARLEELKEAASRLIAIVEDPVAVGRLENEQRFDWNGLQSEFGLPDSMLQSYADLAKFNYDCGDYKGAGAALKVFLALSGGAAGSQRGPSALWGRLACEILSNNSEGALALIRDVKAMIEYRGGSAIEQLQQRSWLLHWSLFVFFNHANGRDELIALFFEEKFLQAIQTNCPWLLRYLVTAVVLTRSTGSTSSNKQAQTMRDLIRVLEQEQGSYSDPITQFLESLYVNFDFDGALLRRRECEQVLRRDFFLCSVCDEFMEAARLFTFETYCRIHRKIDVALLAAKMDMDADAAEKWIADLIRTSQLDAKIDSRDNSVVMGASFPSVYQQVIEKTDDLSLRSYVLINNLKQYAQDHANGLTDDPNYGQQRGGYGGGGRGGGRGRGGGGFDRGGYRD
ncbi:eukaryotic translation initiation factor eIF3 e subunit [Tribonema minus]|uniref:Eukaryotic translation initiation factor 3 subunit E n=1 Tax=Tribonema minus TaxID=303371 RepID=A0A836CBR3_9STRA|nr:eukaryotic translation initiation factor eIF3 e subunit [Tribonema minus]